MQYTYQLRQDMLRDESGIEWVVYGIETLDSVGNILCSFSDIFFDKKKALSFVCVCNEQDIDPIHIQDLIEDALTQQYQVYP